LASRASPGHLQTVLQLLREVRLAGPQR
jgi:hypothetical protein